MILTWVFRALFVPLLVLALITSNCSAAEAAIADAVELALSTRISLDEVFESAARLVFFWWGALSYRASTRVRSDADFLLECL